MSKGKKSVTEFKVPTGMKDILAGEQHYWDFILKVVKNKAEDYGFSRIDTPILEDTNLFVRGVGGSSDIVSKEMFSFVSIGGDRLTLRPEFTAGIARAYLENSMQSLPQPAKLYSFGSLFRYERPQAGRLREHHQASFEVIGERTPAVDAQCIKLAWRILQSLKLKNLVLHINSVGCEECRKGYKKILINYLQKSANKLCGDCKRRIKMNPLRILDCKEESCQEIIKDAPQIIDYLCITCNKHFKSVLEYLDELNLSYNLNSKLVRGLDYYTNTVFEIAPLDKEKRQASLGGGGRYDALMETIGSKKNIPAFGFGLGVERLILALKEQKINVPLKEVKKDVFLIQLGGLAKRKALKIFEDLQDAGVSVAESFGKDNITTQLRIADKMEIPFVLIIGQKEALENTVIVRDMISGTQEILDSNKTVDWIKKNLKK